MSLKLKKIFRSSVFWLVALYLMIPLYWLAGEAIASLSSQYYFSRLGADQTGMYGSNWSLTSLTAATTGTALIVPDASKRLVIEKIIISSDAELDLELAYGTTTVQCLPTLHIGERGGLVCDPYIALTTAATFYCITTDTANYEIWTRYREIP